MRDSLRLEVAVVHDRLIWREISVVMVGENLQFNRKNIVVGDVYRPALRKSVVVVVPIRLA